MADVQPIGEQWQAEDEFNVRHHFMVLRSRFWTILACTVVVVTLATIHAFRSTPIYEASARLVIERRLLSANPFDDGGGERQDKEYFATQVNLITSRAVLEEAIRIGGLEDVFADRGPDASRGGVVGSALRELRVLFDEEPSRPAEPWERLREAVLVAPIKDTNLVDVKVAGAAPRLDAQIANAVAQAYVDFSVTMRQESAGAAFQVLTGQRREQEAELGSAEDRLIEFQESVEIPGLGATGQPGEAMSRLRALNDEYTAVQLRRIEFSVATDAIRESESGGGVADEAADDGAAAGGAPAGGAAAGEEMLGSLLEVGLIRKDPTVAALYDRLMRVQLDEQDALEAYGELHPQIIALRREADQLRLRLAEAVVQVGETARSDYDMLVAREAELAKAIDAESRVALDQTRKARVFERLERDQERQARVFDVIVDRMKEVDLTKDAAITNVSLVEAAMVPQSPVRPNKQRAVILGLFLGLMLGVGLAYGLEYLDDTVKTPDDVERKLRMPWLGYVPVMRAKASGDAGFPELASHTLLNPKSSYTEAFRSIRTNVYFSGVRGEMKSVMVTSAAPQDGKSVFAANLAATVAQDGKRVLLVDADLRRPMLHKAFGTERGRGLTDLLCEGAPLADIVQSPAGNLDGELRSFHILSAGTRTGNPAELLGSEAMARFVRESREQYDMVIYDACPAMFVADSAGLASVCDGVVLMLKSAKTRREAAERARRQIEAVGGKVIGAVLNRVLPRSLRYYSYYGYGYYSYDYDRYYKGYKDKDKDGGPELALPIDLSPASGTRGNGSGTAAGPGAVEAVQRASSFIVRRGKRRFVTFELRDGQEAVLGRDSSLCHVQLPSDNVSRQHCRICREDGRIMVEDLHTKNGTLVNGKRVDDAEVHPGDVIKVATYEVSVGGLAPED